MSILAAIIVTLAALVGVVLTVVTLPGVWLAILVAVACVIWQPGIISIPMLVAAIVLALIGEIVELFWSAAGAAKQGSSKLGGLGALIGGLVGAIAATFLIPIPIIGTLVGAVLGAACGAVFAERGIHHKPWRESLRIGRGAAVGRVQATIAKSILAVMAALLLIVGVWIGVLTG